MFGISLCLLYFAYVSDKAVTSLHKKEVLIDIYQASMCVQTHFVIF